MCVAPTDAFVSLNRPGQQTTIRAV
jgi:hypothetical protein